MFAILKHPTHPLPALVNTESRDYLELVFAGYQVIDTGGRKRLEETERQMIEDACMSLDIEND